MLLHPAVLTRIALAVLIPNPDSLHMWEGSCSKHSFAITVEYFMVLKPMEILFDSM
jgi:hypothetical protein